MSEGATSTIFGPEFDAAQYVDAGNDDDLDWLNDEGKGEAAAAARAAGQQPNPDVPPQQSGTEEAPVPSEPTQPVVEAEVPPAQGTEVQPQPGQEPAQQTPDTGNPLEGTQFKDVASLLKSYNELRSTWNKTLAEKQRDALKLAQAQAELEQFRAPQQPQLSPEQAQALLQDPQRLQEYIASQVQAGTQQTVQQMESQRHQAQLTEAAQRFMEKHPDVLPNSPVDQEMGLVIDFYQRDREGNVDYGLFPITEENLEVAHQLATDPNLRQTMRDLDLIPDNENLAIAREAIEKPAFKAALIANPEAVNTVEGLEFARQLAALPGLYSQAAQAAQPPTQEQMRAAAHVETGGTGAPLASAPGQVPKDEFDEDLELWDRNQGDNIFGLQVL